MCSVSEWVGERLLKILWQIGLKLVSMATNTPPTHTHKLTYNGEDGVSTFSLVGVGSDDGAG